LRCSIVLGVIAAAVVGTFVADRFDQRKFLLWMQLVGALQALALLGVFFCQFNLWLVLALSLLGWLAAGFDGCIRVPFYISVVGDKDVNSAFGVSLQVAQVAALIGYYATSELITHSKPYGEAVCFAFNAISFAAPIMVLVWIGKTQNFSVVKANIASMRTFDLIRKSWAVKAFKQTMLQTGVDCLFAMYSPIFLAVFAKNVHGGGAATFGWFWMAWTIGKLLGCIISGAITTSHNRWAGWALVAQAPMMILFALTASVQWAMVFIAGCSLLNHLLLNLNAVGITLLADAENRGSVASMRVAFGCTLEFISVWGAGQLADVYGVQATTAGYGFAGLAASLVLLFSFRNRKG
jgi:predicted MFS family arabinose efflux permease